MNYCPNPACDDPQNPNGTYFCKTCGAVLLLGDRYRLLQPISAGGFGTTFLAVDESQAAKPRCVVKQFSPRLPNRTYAEKAAALFQEEADRLRQLDEHPQIPQLLDRFQQAGEQYLVQAFVDGQNLEELLTEQSTFSERQIRALLNSLLPVLQFIHEHQVIHRDVKPANIILPYQDDRLVLVDFGASKFATGTALSRTGTVIGSAGYAAPEQVIGKATFASDLYSLGVTCVHLLTGLHPFDLYCVGDDRWIWEDYLTQPISDRLGYVLDGMLQRSLNQRYRSALEILQDLNGGRLTASPRSSDLNAEQQGMPTATAAVSRESREVIPAALSPWFCDQRLMGHQGAVTALAVSPDEFLIASGSSDRTVRLWSLATGRLIHTFAARSSRAPEGHLDRVNALCFSDDCQFLLSGSEDGSVKIWDLDRRKLVNTFANQGWGVTAMALSSQSGCLAVGSGDGLIQLWDWQTRSQMATLRKHRDRVTGLAFGEEGEIVISSSHDKTLRIWDVETAEISEDSPLLNTLRSSDRFSDIILSPDEALLVSASWDGNLRIWDLDLGMPVHTVPAHRDRINSLILSPEGRYLASAGEDGLIKVWEWSDRRYLIELFGTLQASWAVNALAFSDDGEFLLSGSTDETIQIWRKRR